MNTEVKNLLVCKKRFLRRKKGGVSLSPIAHHLMFGLKVLAASGSLLQLLGSVIFLCLLCLMLTMHYEGSLGEDFAVVGAGITVADGLSAVELEWNCHVTEEWELMLRFALC